MRKLYTPDELRMRLEAEAARCIEHARTRHYEGELPSAYLFTFDRASLCDAAAAVAVLLRADGWHRPEVRMGAIALTADAVVLELYFPEEWTDVVHEGELAFPVEPFILVGPSLPASHVEGQPIPRVRLPRWPACN